MHSFPSCVLFAIVEIMYEIVLVLSLVCLVDLLVEQLSICISILSLTDRRHSHLLNIQLTLTMAVSINFSEPNK